MADFKYIYPLNKIDFQIDQFRTVFLNSGTFSFLLGQKIKSVVSENNIPKEYGAYVISGVSGERRDVLYIGRSGTVYTDGKFAHQALRGRLTNKQGKEPRQLFFERMIREHSVRTLHFEWFITHDHANKVLPVLAESLLLQAYYEEHGCLPPYNKSA